MKTSAEQTRISNRRLSTSDFRSIVTQRLLREATPHQSGTLFTLGPIARNGSPAPGGSTLITSAPRSASRLEQNGAAITAPTSITRKPASGNVDALLIGGLTSTQCAIAATRRSPAASGRSGAAPDRCARRLPLLHAGSPPRRHRCAETPPAWRSTHHPAAAPVPRFR